MIKAQAGWELIRLPLKEEESADVGISDGLDLPKGSHGIPWVVCADFKRRSDVQSALDMGVKACVSIQSSWLELVNGIKMASYGHTYLCYHLSQMMYGSLQANGIAKDRCRVTEREAEVLRLIAKGQTSKEIGKSLDMSPHTVEAHRRNIKQKTGCHRVAELTVLAIELDGIKF